MGFKFLLVILISFFSYSALAGKKENIIRWLEKEKNCEGVVASPRFDGNFCESLRYLQSDIQPYPNSTEAFDNAPVVFLGDTHPNVLLKKWIIRNLANFKGAGFTHVALEFLNSESQSAIDAYLKNPKLRPQIVKLVTSDWGWIPEEHVQVIDAIHAAGLKVVAIDNRNELLRKNLGNDIQLRNIHMTSHIEHSLADAHGGRVLVLTGKLHSSLTSDEAKIQTLPQMLKTAGILSLSFNLESGEEPVPRNITQAFLQELRLNKLVASKSGDYFLPADPQEVDGVIFISR